MEIYLKDECYKTIGACMALLPEHRAQVINYLKITGKKVGLLVNFGEKSLKFERLILEKEQKSVVENSR